MARFCIAALLAGFASAAIAQTPSLQSSQSPQSSATSTSDPPAPSVIQAASPVVPAISDAVNPQAALDYVIQKPLFGELAFRRYLQDSGIDLTAHYISETMANTAGYKGTGTDYAQQVDFGVGFDLGRLGVWSNSIAQFAMSDRAGRSTAGDFTGSYFAYQEIFGQGQNLRIDEISVEKTLSASAVALKVGFYPLGNDFATLPYVCNFINVAFCGHPQSLPNDSGWSDGPAGRWGGRVKWLITDQVTLQAGAFDSNPTITARQSGFRLGFSGSTGVIAPIELGYHIGKEPSDYGGTYKIGAYYDSSSAADLANPQRTDAGRYGLYLEAAQQVFKTGLDRRNGLALFAVYTISDQNTAKFRDYVEAGAAYRGLIAGRDLDLMSLGYVRADINSRFQTQLASAGDPVQTSEELIELDYTVQVIPSMTVRPDVQYDIRPGALSRHPDTWVLGFQVKLSL